MQEQIQKQWMRWRRIDRWTDRVILIFLLGALAFVIALITGQIQMIGKGLGSDNAPDFRSLCAVNGDTVAWLSIDDTGIAHPVVQGKDNFEYLDKAFTGEFYAGGTLFLDADNQKDFSDAYSVIYGHHMAGGSMFGDLDRFLDPEYRQTHQSGLLQTPDWDWDLKTISAGNYDAYDGRVFSVGELRLDDIRSDEGPDQQILALSTCTDEMNDDRTVVFFKMIHRRKHGR
ncbi:MAG: class B sortase [Firmicutes bacterium]|nr:class B sortase [Bacillota bacterium]